MTAGGEVLLARVVMPIKAALLQDDGLSHSARAQRPGQTSPIEGDQMT
ncbi:hypothetical protein [Streptomyces sp. NBC_01361]|nr:hypothetical protein [Streptomyces sp. NBC_01361]